MVGFAGATTYSVDCNKPGSPRLFLLPNGLVFEYKGKKILSDAQYETSTTFGQSPPEGFQKEFAGSAFAAYLFIKDRRIYANLAEADDVLYQQLPHGGTTRLDACTDVAGPEWLRAPSKALRPAPPLEVVGTDILFDRSTGLQWTRQDNGRDIDKRSAVRHCQSLALAGGGWRLPASNELNGLLIDHQLNADGTTPCGAHGLETLKCHISGLFKLSGPTFWSADVYKYAGDFGTMQNFYLAAEPYTSPASYSDGARALCSRNAKPVTSK